MDRQVTITKQEERKLNPGYSRYSTRGSLSYLSWFHKRAVHTLSNGYDPVGDDFIEQWFPAKRGEVPQTVSGKIKRRVTIPPIIVQYRKNMGGVDTFDQLRSYVKIEMRSLKFWHPMMYFIIESTMVNSWVLYKRNRELAGLPLCSTFLWIFEKLYA